MCRACRVCRSLFAVTLAVAVALRVHAGVGPSDNLLLNGRFDADQVELPFYWYSPNVPQVISVHSSDGPGGLPFVRFAAPQGKVSWRESCLRQRGIELVSNGIYRISAWVRTRGFRAASSGIGIANTGWTTSCILDELPENCGWREMKRDVAMCGSSDGLYSAVIYANDFSGELDVADFRLCAVDAAACAGSNPSRSGATEPRLVPWKPLLHKISRADHAMTFRFFGKVPSGRTEDYDVVVTADGGQSCVRQRLKPDLNTLVLPPGATGGKFCLEIAGRKNGKTVFSREYSYSTVDSVASEASGHRRLNNLVTEVLSAPIVGADAEQRFEFTTLREGWTFTALRAAVEPGIEVWVDGKSVIREDTPRLETFRFLPAGRHAVCVRNVGADGQIVVRTIPELFNYCPGVDNSIEENPHYDWDFQMKHMFSSVTTLNGGVIPPDKIGWLKANGYRWLANFHVEDLVDEGDLARRLASASGIRKPQYDGVTCDELFFGRFDQIQFYTSGLRAFDGVDDRLLYTWIVGKPGLSGVDHDFISACCNASRGRGRLLCEAYCRTKATEDEARSYLSRYVGETFASFRAWHPMAAQAAGVIFGNFSQIPILSLSHHPEVDYKYFLDMQLNYVATDPIFDGLGCVGYWGSSYANEEQYRWSFMLLRHYCIEGRTDMLSEEYGLSYIPDLLRNGDFRGTLAPWVVSGDARTESHLGFGSRAQNRWGDNGDLGDTFAALGRASSLSQRVRGLVPGRLYCLQASVFSAMDAKADKVDPRRFPLTCNVLGAVEVQPTLSWTHVDHRIKGRYARNNGVARTNLHHVVFKAKGESAEVMLRNDGDEELGVNCVSLNPYVPERTDCGGGHR